MASGRRQSFLLLLAALGLTPPVSAALDLRPLADFLPRTELIAGAGPSRILPAPASVNGWVVPRVLPMPYLAAPGKSATVSLAPILNKHWLTTTSFTHKGTKVYLAGQLDLAGDGYVAVSASTATVLPLLFKIERGMTGRFKVNNIAFSVSLSVSIFRPRLDNRIVIREEKSQAVVYDRSIGDFFNDTYWAGQDVLIGSYHYRLFYTYLVDPAKSAFDKTSYGFCLVYDDTSYGDHEYYFYMIAQSDIDGPAPVSYELFGGQRVNLRVDTGKSVLELTR